MRTREEIAEDLLDINRMISLFWIGLKQQPTEEAITELNMKLGRLIKELRDGDETEQKKTEIDELIKLNRRLPTLF